MRLAFLSRRALASAFFLSLLAVSCKDGTGPGELVGSLAIVPVFESSAAGIVPVERLRVVLLRDDSVTVAKDTIFDLVAGQDSVDLAISVTLLSTSERFLLEMQLINAAQDTVFRGGPTTVTASTSATDPTVTEILLVYTGTGFDATAVQITTTAASGFFGETISLAADALDAAGSIIPGTPIKWSSVNPAAGSFPDDELGAFVVGNVRGSALVAATLLTGPTDTAVVMVQPLPSAIAIASGNDQIDVTGATLPQPIVVTVTAADGLGVEGVEVLFGVAVGNGSLSVTSVFTDALGMAQSIWTLGSVPGAMQATATVPAAGNASVTFAATAQVITFRWINALGGNWSIPTNWDLGSVPSVASTVIIDLAGIYTVNLDVVADVGVLTLGALTGTQTLSIAANTLTLSTASTVGANGVISMSGGTLSGVQLTVGGLLTAGIGATVTLGTLEISGVLTVLGTYTVTNTVFTGGSVPSPQSIPILTYANVEVKGVAQLSAPFGSQGVGGNLLVSGNGILNFNNTLAAVGGDFTTQGNGVIVLASVSDVLTATGNIVFGGGNTGPGSPLCPVLGCLADGTINAFGNFTQLGTNSPQSFHGGDFNTVNFVGTGAQTLSFANTGSGPGTSHFANIAFNNTGLGVTLGSNIYAHCDLLSSAGAAAAVVIGNGNTLTVGGFGASDLQLQHVLLVYDGVPDTHSAGIFSSFVNVTFQGYMATDVQLDVIHLGSVSPINFINITFTTPPLRGVGAYVRTTDPDGAIPVELEIILTVAAPLTCSGADFIADTESDIIASCSMQFDDITAGRAHSCGITVAGTAYCWGNNTFGQLGDGTLVERNLPVPVTGGLLFREISAGSDHTCGITLTSDGYCWGADASGQLGDDGTPTDKSAPTLVFESTGIYNFISAGSEHTCAVSTFGSSFCWGKNTEGQLGNGSTTSSPVPVPVSGAVVFQSISAGTGLLGSAHTCGFDTGLVAYCWGDNTSGQLGNGTTAQALVPTAVSGGTSIAFLTSGDQYTCAVTFAGAGKCWGANADGQLGDGTAVAKNAPVAVFGGLTLDGISTGSRFSCATSSGAVYCWGNNGSGQLGNGTNINSLTPVMVSGGWVLPDLGTGVSEHMCSVTGSGAMFCWGQGLNGRLGNGGTASSNVPVLVSGS